ncbi:MAG: 4'-phosphopantetheinyl transferase superfamily protein [Paramuribaculum sp.]|nr:4'-phosphopantetheinyl transferase superfamily protein [Paramuribaculum sp.]
MVVYVKENIADMGEEDYLLARSLVSDQRRSLSDRYKRRTDRIGSVMAYRALQEGLKKEYDIDGAPEFGYEESGKPFLQDRRDIYFNLSHCDKAAGCVISDRAAGIDIEEIKPLDDEVMDYALSEDEKRRVIESDDPEVEFAKIWTRKESMVKLDFSYWRGDLKSILERENEVIFHTEVHREKGYVVSVAEMR